MTDSELLSLPSSQIGTDRNGRRRRRSAIPKNAALEWGWNRDGLGPKRRTIVQMLSMRSRGSQRRRGSPSRAGWWCRLITATVFAFYINYLPVHLVNEPHSHDARAASHGISGDLDGHHDPDHDGHEKHHVPHPSSEHSIQMLTKWKSLFLCLALPPLTAGFVIVPPETQMAVRFIERVWSPGESPPEPSQPRAPPVA